MKMIGDDEGHSGVEIVDDQSATTARLTMTRSRAMLDPTGSLLAGPSEFLCLALRVSRLPALWQSHVSGRCTLFGGVGPMISQHTST